MPYPISKKKQKTIRRAERDSWHNFVERMNSQTPTARLVKIFRSNETVRTGSNVIKHNGKFTKFRMETLNYLLDISSPGCQQTENLATMYSLALNPFMRPEDTETIENIYSFEPMETAFSEFQPFKAPGPDGLYPVLLQKGWNQLKGYYQRWSPRRRPWPRGHILKSLALASKPSVLKNCSVLGSRTALFFEPLKFGRKTPETSPKICKYLFCFPHLDHWLRQAGLPPN